MFLPLHGWRSSLSTRLSTPFLYSIVRSGPNSSPPSRPWVQQGFLIPYMPDLLQSLKNQAIMRCHRVMYLCVRCSPAMLNMVIWRKTATPAVTPAAANRHVMRKVKQVGKYQSIRQSYERIRQCPVTDIGGWPLVNESSHIWLTTHKWIVAK